MNTTDLTFNDLPKVVGELCERISSMEKSADRKNFHQQHNEGKKGYPCSNDR